MKVEIWSDIRCPFCYIGKRKFESALQNFEQKDEIEVIWRSFELDPSFKTNADINAYDYLAEIKGQTRDWSIAVHNQVAQTAKQVGLDYNFDKAVVANSFNAHRLIQFAKTQGLGDAAEERLFRAYFTEGRNIDDADTLIELGSQIGLDQTAVIQTISTNDFAAEVHADQEKAMELGIRGVPFFLVNEHFGISGAQSPEMFLRALQQGWSEFEKEQNQDPQTNYEAAVCSIDGTCN